MAVTTVRLARAQIRSCSAMGGPLEGSNSAPLPVAWPRTGTLRRTMSGLGPVVPLQFRAKPFRRDDGAGPLRMVRQSPVACKRCHRLQHTTAGRRRADHAGCALGQIVVYGLHPFDDTHRDRTPGSCPPLLVSGPTTHLGAPGRRSPSAAHRDAPPAPRANLRGLSNDHGWKLPTFVRTKPARTECKRCVPLGLDRRRAASVSPGAVGLADSSTARRRCGGDGDRMRIQGCGQNA